MPTRKTHLVFAVLLFVLLKGFLDLDIWLAFFAAIGALLPDLDIHWMHRKVLHNIWVLIVIAWIGIQFNVMTVPQVTAFGLGWLSHLLADSLTHMGIWPFWPITWPRFRGPITVGGKSEWILMGVLLIALAFVFGIVKL